MQKLDTLSFALAGAIYGAACVALATIAALIGFPGFRPFVDLLTQFYGFYGYSVSALGVVVGAFWARGSTTCCWPMANAPKRIVKVETNLAHLRARCYRHVLRQPYSYLFAVYAAVACS
jgi:hypothetical protein